MNITPAWVKDMPTPELRCLHKQIITELDRRYAPRLSQAGGNGKSTSFRTIAITFQHEKPQLLQYLVDHQDETLTVKYEATGKLHLSDSNGDTKSFDGAEADCE